MGLAGEVASQFTGLFLGVDILGERQGVHDRQVDPAVRELLLVAVADENPADRIFQPLDCDGPAFSLPGRP